LTLADRTLLEAANAVLAARAAAARLADRTAPLGDPAGLDPPPSPARPARPPLAPPAGVPRRRLSTPAGRAALLHAIAHIEFNAIDLAFDMAARFAAEIECLGLDAAAFVRDWIKGRER